MFAKRCNLCSSFFQPERYNFINFSSCCLSSRKFATVFKTSLSLPDGIYVLTNYFSKSGEGRCPVVPLVFKTSLGIVRSPEGSTPSLLRQIKNNFSGRQKFQKSFSGAPRFSP